jgi:hypothetical protein
MNIEKYNEFIKKFDSLGNIHGIGIGHKTVDGYDTDEKSIIFSVIKKKPVEEVPENELIPSIVEIDGELIKTDVVESPRYVPMDDPRWNVGRVSHNTVTPTDVYQNGVRLRWSDWMVTDPKVLINNRKRQRSLRGGISIVINNTYDTAGTLGLIAIDNETNSLVGLTNWHVACKGTDPYYTHWRRFKDVNLLNAEIIQPATMDSNTQNIVGRIGVVKRYMPMHPVIDLYTGGRTNKLNEIDAAIIAIDPPSKTPGLIDTDSHKQLDLDFIEQNFVESGYQKNIAPFVDENEVVRPLPWATKEELDKYLSPDYLYGKHPEEGKFFYLYKSARTTGVLGNQEEIIPIMLSQVNVSHDLMYEHYREPYEESGGTFDSFATKFHNVFSYVARSKTSDGKVTGIFNPIVGGDSGSVILAVIEGVMKVIGLTYGGSQADDNVSRNPDGSKKNYSGIACRIDRVAKLLNISAWNGTFTQNGKPVTYSNTNVQETLVVRGKSDKTYIEKDGKKYWQMGTVSEDVEPNYP